MWTLLLTVGLCSWGVAQQKRTTEMERAVEEFRIQTRALGPETDSPHSGGVASRPLWHGRIFENFRDDALDAIPHEVRQRGSDKAILRRNQFGFNIAGPLVIPKIVRARS